MTLFDRDFDREIAEERRAVVQLAKARHSDDDLLAAVAEARAEALAQGHAQGRAEAEAEARAAETEARSAALERIAQRLDAVMAAQAEHRAALERQILGYAATTAEKVLPEILEDRAHARTLSQIRRGLRLGLGTARLEIALPDGAQALHRDVTDLVESRGIAARTTISGDPTLAPGDVRVAWDGGRLDYSFAAICDEILNTLRAHARPTPTPEDRT
ncbi:FliH/SctL family protein [uncultured Limimaricola sp.]|uniref:FliH/SctL family protein n=1 Tax=uncultured Limimaricola sp. TaxID=2211667 RepID=UPI0030F80165